MNAPSFDPVIAVLLIPVWLGGTAGGCCRATG